MKNFKAAEKENDPRIEIAYGDVTIQINTNKLTKTYDSLIGEEEQLNDKLRTWVYLFSHEKG